jgi:hypothetical protein
VRCHVPGPEPPLLSSSNGTRSQTTRPQSGLVASPRLRKQPTNTSSHPARPGGVRQAPPGLCLRKGRAPSIHPVGVPCLFLPSAGGVDTEGVRQRDQITQGTSSPSCRGHDVSEMSANLAESRRRVAKVHEDSIVPVTCDDTSRCLTVEHAAEERELTGRFTHNPEVAGSDPAPATK